MKKIYIILLSIVAALILIGICAYSYLSMTYDGGVEKKIYVPRDATTEDLRDSLISALGEGYGTRVFKIWSLMSGDIESSRGMFVIAPGEKAYKSARKIAKGRQTPMVATINVARTFDEVVERLTFGLEITPDELKDAFDRRFKDSVLITPEVYIAEIIPARYEVYWNVSSDDLIDKLMKAHNQFWTNERLSKASALGLTPAQVVTLASIVEEESNMTDEQPVIARLYLNRLARGMKLQADPTVKFALGDFTLRRISHNHLQVQSPYNTYLFAGLPPGPIRLVQTSTIDAVLNAPEGVDYLYMCAKEDFSGRHNFTSDYNEHLANAKRYSAALDRKGIKLQ